MTRARFGAQRLVRTDQSRAARLLYRAIGVADPAHYLHYLYCRNALDRFGPRNPASILDAGSERGDFTVWLAQRFPAARVVGYEIRTDHLDKASRGTAPLGLENLEYRQGDLRLLDERAAYDLVVCIDVLEHIPEQDDVLRRLRRALRPGGIAFLHVPVRRIRPAPFERWLHAFEAWSAGEHLAEERSGPEFRLAVEAAGFEVVEARATFGYFAGELATSLFNLPYRNTLVNQLAQAAISPLCRLLALADRAYPGRTHFAVAVTARAPAAPDAGGGPPR